MEGQLKYVVQNVRSGFKPHGDNKVFLAFTCSFPKVSNVSVEHAHVLRGMFRSFIARGMYCLKLV